MPHPLYINANPLPELSCNLPNGGVCAVCHGLVQANAIESEGAGLRAQQKCAIAFRHYVPVVFFALFVACAIDVRQPASQSSQAPASLNNSVQFFVGFRAGFLFKIAGRLNELKVNNMT